jgi:hypothetical protein
MGEEAAFNFEEAVVRFRVNVLGRIGARFFLFKVIRGGGVEEVAIMCLALLLDGSKANIFARIKERLGEGKEAVVNAAAAEALNEFAGFFSEPRGVWWRV